MKISGTKLHKTTTKFSSRMYKIINYATSNNITLPPIYELKAIDSFIKNAKLFLDKMDVFYILDGSGSVAFKMINIVNPGTYNGTSSGGLTYSSDGVLGNGANGHIDTNFNPTLLVSGQKYQLNNASFGSIISTYNAGSGSVANCTVLGFDISTTELLTKYSYCKIHSSNKNLAAFIKNTTGLLIINRTNANTAYAIDRNTITTDTNNPSIALPNLNLNILSLSNSSYSTHSVCNGFAGESITFNESQQFRTMYNKCRAERGLSQVA